MTHDGLGKYLGEIITKADGPTADEVREIAMQERHSPRWCSTLVASRRERFAQTP